MWHPYWRCGYSTYVEDDLLDGDEIISGAKNYIRNSQLDSYKDKEYLRREKHAYIEYDRIKNSNHKHQIDKIYNNIKNLEEMKDFTRNDLVEIAFNHVF